MFLLLPTLEKNKDKFNALEKNRNFRIRVSGKIVFAQNSRLDAKIVK